MATHFIGYGTLEGWAQAVSVMKTVYAESIQQPGQETKQGFRADRLVVQVAQIDGDGHVHYCHLPCGRLSFVCGQPFDRDADERKERLDQVYHLVMEWLKEHGFSVRRAMIAHSTDMVLLDGWAEFLEYDKETKRFYRADKESEHEEHEKDETHEREAA